MSTIEFENKLYTCAENESVLNTLIRGGADVSFSCRKGTCNACVLSCKKGEVSKASQESLHTNLKDKGYFLPCSCYLENDNNIVVEKINQNDLFKQGVIVEKELIASNECILKIEFLNSFKYEVSQYINLWKDSSKFHPYFLFKHQTSDKTIEINIQLINNYEISKWVFNDLQVGDFVEVQGPYGEIKDKNADVLNNDIESDPEHTEEPHIFPDPDPEIWQALENGVLLRELLVDFYTDVYNDELLAPFFSHTNLENSVQKQYNFLYQVFTGEDVFFGHFPRNGHHWMVISNELFDYREKLMITKLKKYNIPQHLIDRWINMEEKYRKQIVKTKPWNKIAFGIEFPADGYGELVLDINLVCDGCQREVFSGETVKYHNRLGKIYCAGCQAITI